MIKTKSGQPVMCENCDETHAQFWRSTTNEQGEVLQREALCLDCAGGTVVVGADEAARALREAEEAPQ